MNSTPRTAGPVWLKKQWKLVNNPFPTTGIARLGGSDRRENGLLYEPAVNAEKLQEATEKFVLGAAFSGLRFGYLWSTGTGPGDSDARGFGKSVLMQHLVWSLNQDYGRASYLACGLDEDDAAEAPICGLLTSFDTAQIRSLNAALFTSVEYATDFRIADDDHTLSQRLRIALVEKTGVKDPQTLAKVVAEQHRSLRGRTLGPPDDKLILALCDADPAVAADYLDKVKPASRTRNGAVYLATFLLFAAAAGMKHVLLCCDQLEDLASTTTAKAKRDLETERFRDIILETLPMADMLSIVVTMHPRAALTIGTAWELADLPTFEVSEANKHRIVVLPPLRDLGAATKLLTKYLDDARKSATDHGPESVYPFTPGAIEALFTRSSRKPRDVLRKAHGLIEAASGDNLDLINEEAVGRYLDALGPDTESDIGPFVAAPATTSPDWSEG
ncbi:hypothetical protein [Actinocrispum wychmicini]|uniref:Uncharacterized protein n=1 Tax=Actinocrispum wychmicini TaxID=1213861 RepID=A0A4R2K2C4_9PSEU|nr:hypothetical protein [Actinocrispum wychmicini]TCO65867.1 hypothetical protein EV192_1011659 [Actinocrispum wychmicini]